MRMESTGNRRNSLSRWEAAAFSGGTSRMNREIHVRICERLGVQFPGPTRRSAGDRGPYADQIPITLTPPTLRRTNFQAGDVLLSIVAVLCLNNSGVRSDSP